VLCSYWQGGSFFEFDGIADRALVDFYIWIFVGNCL